MHIPTMPTVKPNTFRLYLNEEDTALMSKICEVTECGQSELLSRLMAAALRCVAANNHRFPLPLRFRIQEEAVEEPLTKRTTTPTRK